MINIVFEEDVISVGDGDVIEVGGGELVNLGGTGTATGGIVVVDFAVPLPVTVASATLEALSTAGATKTPIVGDSCLLQGQSPASGNGIYDVVAGTPCLVRRSTQPDAGELVGVENGVNITDSIPSTLFQRNILDQYLEVGYPIRVALTRAIAKAQHFSYINVFSEAPAGTFAATLAYLLATDGSLTGLSARKTVFLFDGTDAAILQSTGPDSPPVLYERQPLEGDTYHSHLYVNGSQVSTAQRLWECRQDRPIGSPHGVTLSGAHRGTFTGGEITLFQFDKVDVDLAENGTITFPPAAFGDDPSRSVQLSVKRNGFTLSLVAPDTSFDTLVLEDDGPYLAESTGSDWAWWLDPSMLGGGGGGDVSGPNTSTDGAPAGFDGTDGKTLKQLATNTANGLVKLDGDATIPDILIPASIARDSEISSAISDHVADSDAHGDRAYAEALFAANDALVFKGSLNCSTNPNYPAADAGHTYRVAVAGKIGGGSGVNVEAGDLLMCIVDSTGAGTHASVGANWAIGQANIDGAVIGPASSTDGNLPVLSGTTGKLLADSGISAAALAASVRAVNFRSGSTVSVASVTDVVVASCSLGAAFASGDMVRFSAVIEILNTAGANRTYTPKVKCGSSATVTMTAQPIGTGTTIAFQIDGVLTATGTATQELAAKAANDAVNLFAGRHASGTETNAGLSIDFTIASNNATGTQTAQMKQGMATIHRP